jgi:plastocyanin
MALGWRRATVGGAVVLMLTGTACRGSGTTSASPAGPGGLATTPVGPNGGTGGGGNPNPTETGVLTVTQDNFQFDPTMITVNGGSTISVQNLNGTTPHTFTIKDSDVDVVNDHGQTSNVKIDLPPGTYTFFCRFHVSLGMKGTIVVE